MPHTLDQERYMICHPLEWPLINLPLKKSDPFKPGNTAVFAPSLNTVEINLADPIEIRIGTIYHKLSKLPVKRYDNVDALLADGWRAD